MLGERKIAITLTDDERRLLIMWARTATEDKRHAQRAQVILCSAEGLSLPEISKRSGLSRQNCSRWRMRFLKNRIDGLQDLPRKGRPPVITPETKRKVARLACTEPPDGSNQWTRQSLAKVVGIGKTTVHRILTEGEFQYQKTDYWCGRNPDSEFESKQTAILGLYLNPPEKALVLCVDEKSRIQALDQIRPMLPLCSGKPGRLTATCRRHGTTCLLAALSVHEDVVTARPADRSSHGAFLNFLKHLYRSNPGKYLHIIMDNPSIYEHEDVMDWAQRRRRLAIHFAPTYASWLSQVEIWFNIFTRGPIGGGLRKSKKQMIDQIMQYIKRYSRESVHPFAWTYAGKPLVTN